MGDLKYLGLFVNQCSFPSKILKQIFFLGTKVMKYGHCKTCLNSHSRQFLRFVASVGIEVVSIQPMTLIIFTIQCK